MPDIKYKLVRGGTSGVDSTPLRDGQILFDKEGQRVLLDAYINGILTRIVMTEDVFVGATSETDGQVGLVPRPMKGDETKFLKGDGTWGLGGTFSGDYNDLTNKPTLGTASSLDVAESGNASSTQVVKGNDTRLTDARPASDVSSWAKESTKPSYTASEVGAYTKSEVDNLISTLETNIDWKEAVATFSDIATTYPNPEDGWTVNVKDTDYTYRYNGSNWVVISANAIPEATTSVNGLMTTAQVTKLNGINSGAEVNVQSDWSVTDSSSDAFIKNKPTLGTAAAKDVASSGNASTSQVVMGNDTRLSDARPASDVSSWAKAATKPSYTAAEVGAIPTTDKGSNNGVAELDSTGKVPSSQLPSFLTLGETSSTAYRGDRGKTAYDHSQTTSGNPHNVTKSDVGLGNVGNFKAVSTVASQGLTDTEKSNARGNIGAGTSSLALGTSSSTAYRGDYGNSAYTHAVTNKGSAFASGLYKITTNSEGHVTAATAVAKADITGLGIPAQDTTYSAMTDSEIQAGTSTTARLITPAKFRANIDNKTWMGTCATAAATAAKVVSVDTGFLLVKGARIGVKFTNTNTASSVTLNVNNTGAKSIYYNNAVYTSTSNMVCGYANRYTFYVYDGTNWVWDSYGTDANTTYSAMSTSELTTGTATTSRVVRADYLNAAIDALITADVVVNTTGTASASAVAYQRIGINDTYTALQGTMYMLISNTSSASYVFTNSNITSNSSIDVYTDTYGDNPSSVSVSGNTCTVTFSEAKTRSVKIYIK